MRPPQTTSLITRSKLDAFIHMPRAGCRWESNQFREAGAKDTSQRMTWRKQSVGRAWHATLPLASVVLSLITIRLLKVYTKRRRWLHDNKDLNYIATVRPPSTEKTPRDQFMKMKTMPTNYQETTQNLKTNSSTCHAPEIIEREQHFFKQMQPHVSLPRWHQLVLLFSQLPPCCRDLHGKGFVR